MLNITAAKTMLRLINLLYPHGIEGFFSTFNLIQRGQQGGVIL